MVRWWPVVFLVACAPSAQSFPDAYARTLCDRYRDCFEADFDALYEDEAACRDDLGGFFELIDVDACTYDGGAGGACLRSVRSASCEELDNGEFPDCTNVYAECG